MSSNRYLEAAEEVLRKAETRREIIDAPCSDCKYYKRDWMGDSFSECTNPIVQLAAASLDQRSDAEYLAQCKTQRSTHSPFGPVVCGPNGTLFEARS